MKVENQRWSLTIEGLRSDRGQLERIARKELGLVKPNEVIYQFPSSDRK
ncbi:MAG: FtsB family cell division protein [Trichlorobacter sp.]